MNNILTIIFTILVVIFLVFILTSAEPLTKFQLDLIAFDVNEKMARNIDLYFRGEREYLTWDELREIIRVYNLVYEEAGRPELVGNISDIINQFNFLITE